MELLNEKYKDKVLGTIGCFDIIEEKFLVMDPLQKLFINMSAIIHAMSPLS